MNINMEIPEPIVEDTDLYDGLIATAYEGGITLSSMDTDTLSKLYERAVRYIDILGYKYKPDEDSQKCEDARNLSVKLKVANVDLATMKLIAKECSRLLMSRD